MAVEAGAKVGFSGRRSHQTFSPRTGQENNYIPIMADDDAVYEKNIKIKLSELEPMVANRIR